MTPEANWFTVRERIDAAGRDRRAADRRRDRPRRRRRSRRAACATSPSACSSASSTRDHEQPPRRALPRGRAHGEPEQRHPARVPRVRARQHHRDQRVAAADGRDVPRSASRSRDLPPQRRDRFQIMHSAGGTLSVDRSRPPGRAAGPLRPRRRRDRRGVRRARRRVRQRHHLRHGRHQHRRRHHPRRPAAVDDRRRRSTACPIGLPMFDIHTVGAGGGSIAYLDAGGALRVGPRSAGAVPGPACYGRGGTEPTVTDANLVLGRILPDAFLGGAMRSTPTWRAPRSSRSPARWASRSIETALGIVRVAEANMAAPIRAVTSPPGPRPARLRARQLRRRRRPARLRPGRSAGNPAGDRPAVLRRAERPGDGGRAAGGGRVADRRAPGRPARRRAASPPSADG